MDPKGYEKKPWFPYMENMYNQIEGDVMSVDAKGYEEKPWWPYVLDLQKKIEEGGGGGSSDFSMAEVTIVNNSQGIFTLIPTTLELDSKLLGFRWTTNGVDSQQEYEYIQNTETTDKFYISRGYYMFGYNQTLADAAAYTVTGNAEVTVADNMPLVKITGDCTITMQ